MFSIACGMNGDADVGGSPIWKPITCKVPLEGRERLLTVSHVQGYPIKASISSDGKYMAYTILHSGDQPAFAGSLELYELGSRSQPSVVDVNIDYGWAPKWAPTANTLVYVKKAPASPPSPTGAPLSELWSSDHSGNKVMIYRDSEALELVPIGWAPDGSTFYFDTILPNGDDLYSLSLSTGLAHFIAHLSETAAYNLAVSPDGHFVVGSVSRRQDHARFALVSVSLQDASISLLQRVADTPYSLAWNIKDGSLAISGKPGSIEHVPFQSLLANAPTTSRLRALRFADSPDRISLELAPLAWSQDGRWLALEVRGPNRPKIEFLEENGSVLVSPLSSQAWQDFVGWIH